MPLLEAALHAARACGAPGVAADAAEALAQRGQRTADAGDAHTGLTSRQRRVTELTAAGLDPHEVAQRLFLTPGTVRAVLESTTDGAVSRPRVRRVRRAGSSRAQVGRGRLGRPDREDADDPRARAPRRQDRAEALRGLCGGAVHLPGDAAVDEARLPWNLRSTPVRRPSPTRRSPHEVADVVRTAASVGLRVAPQGTGHGAPPLAGSLEDAVLLRTSAMTELRVDAERRTARVGAGVRWGDVVERAGRVGLAARHTSSPGVGVVGSSLGGGLSWYARQPACSAVR